MTDPTNVEVTQADREAAAAMCKVFYPGMREAGSSIIARAQDNHPLAQAFARHRIAAEEAARLTPPVQDAGEVEVWRPMREAPRDGTSILALHRHHGVSEAYFSPGTWSADTPVAPAEYDGAVWVLGDDLEQVEVEEYGSGAPEPYHDGDLIGWLPRAALPAPATGEVA